MASMYARKLETNYYHEETKKVEVLIPKKRWISKGEKVIYSLFTIAVILVSIYIVSFSSTIDTVNRDLQQLESSVEQQMLTNETLQSQVRELSEPSRILGIAEANGLNIDYATVEQANKIQ